MDYDKQRLGMYRKIEIARKQLPSFGEADFRGLLQRKFGVTSRKSLTLNQLSRLIDTLAEMGASFTVNGKEKKVRPRPASRPDWIEITDSMPYAREKRQILAIWRKLGYSMTSLDTRVSILKLHPGITPQVVRNILCGPETRAVIIETYGSGNATSRQWFLDMVRESVSMGKIIVNVTQCLAGSVNMDLYATGKKLEEAGVKSGYDSSTEGMLAKLFFLMGKSESDAEVIRQLDENLRGEITK